MTASRSLILLKAMFQRGRRLHSSHGQLGVYARVLYHVSRTPLQASYPNSSLHGQTGPPPFRARRGRWRRMCPSHAQDHPERFHEREMGKAKRTVGPACYQYGGRRHIGRGGRCRPGLLRATTHSGPHNGGSRYPLRLTTSTRSYLPPTAPSFPHPRLHAHAPRPRQPPTFPPYPEPVANFGFAVSGQPPCHGLCLQALARFPSVRSLPLHSTPDGR